MESPSVPASAAARFGGTLGVAAAVLLAAGAGSANAELLPPFAGFLLVVMSLGLALVGLVTSIAGLVATTPGKGVEGRSSAVRGLVLSLLVLVLLANGASKGRGLPRINDITTNTDDPPVFVTALETDPGRDMSYPGESFAEQQQKAYPDLATLVLREEPGEAFDRVRAVLAAMPRMQITGEDRGAGRIEATETSALFRFADDLVVRIRRFEDGGSRVDFRSKSRVGKGDLGVNAGRIRTIIARLRAADPPPGD